MAGTLYVKARPSQVKTITGLMEKYKEILGRQVMLEARILEVRLSDQYQAGIDWAMLRKGVALTNGLSQTLNGVGTNGPFDANLDTSNAPVLTIGGAAQGATMGALAGAGNLYGTGIGILGSDGYGLVNLLKQFGDVTVVSNPTIRARHGQPALISVGRTSTYIQSIETNTQTTTTQTTTTEDINTAKLFNGLLLGVTAFIGQDGMVTLNIHPIKSDVDAASLSTTTVFNRSVTLPRVDLKEMSTVLELRDQDVVLLGGLISKESGRVSTGAPVLSDIPLLGRLFTKNSEVESTQELVIMLRVHIL
ncbi:MAG: pilus (MSHA type) biogenesis protein MshL [Magnetococcus sp. WYHC-3]